VKERSGCVCTCCWTLGNHLGIATASVAAHLRVIDVETIWRSRNVPRAGLLLHSTSCPQLSHHNCIGVGHTLI
jgi:hypothetical protein